MSEENTNKAVSVAIEVLGVLQVRLLRDQRHTERQEVVKFLARLPQMYEDDHPPSELFTTKGCTFPGVWEKWNPPATGATYRICHCGNCQVLWPSRMVAPGRMIEVAGSHGVFVAKVLNSYLDGNRKVQIDIESSDRRAPDYLRRKVHAKWTIARGNSMWRETTLPMEPYVEPTRYDREEVVT